MRRLILGLVVSLLSIPTTAVAQVVIGPPRLRAAPGVDTSELQRMIEDAVWRGAARAGAIISDLGGAPRKAIQACGTSVTCLGNVTKDARAKFLLLPVVGQEEGDIVIRTCVVIAEKPRILKILTARWATEEAKPDALLASVTGSLKELTPLFRGDKEPDELYPPPPRIVRRPPPPVVAETESQPAAAEARPVPSDRVDAKTDAKVEPGRGAADAGVVAGVAEGSAEKPKAAPPDAGVALAGRGAVREKVDLAAWAAEAKARARASGGFALRVTKKGDVVENDLAEVIRVFGIATEQVTGLAPVLDRWDGPCAGLDRCIPEILARAKAQELIFFIVEPTAAGLRVSGERVTGLTLAVSRGEVVVSGETKQWFALLDRLAGDLYPEGKNLTPSIPEPGRITAPPRR